MSGLYGHLVHTKSSFTSKDFYCVICLFTIQASIFFVYAIFDLKKQDDVIKMLSEAKEFAVESIHKLSDHLKKSSDGTKSNDNGTTVQEQKDGTDDKNNPQNGIATSVSSSSTSSVHLLNTSSDEISLLQSQLVTLKNDNEVLQKKIKTLEEVASSVPKIETNDNKVSEIVSRTESTDSWFFSANPTKSTDSDQDKKKQIDELQKQIEKLQEKLINSEKEITRLKNELYENSMALYSIVYYYTVLHRVLYTEYYL